MWICGSGITVARQAKIRRATIQLLHRGDECGVTLTPPALSVVTLGHIGSNFSARGVGASSRSLRSRSRGRRAEGRQQPPSRTSVLSFTHTGAHAS